MFDFSLVPMFSKYTLYGIILILISIGYAIVLRPMLVNIQFVLSPLIKLFDSIAIPMFLLGFYLIWGVSFIQRMFGLPSEWAFWLSIIIAVAIAAIIYQLKHGNSRNKDIKSMF